MHNGLLTESPRSARHGRRGTAGRRGAARSPGLTARFRSLALGAAVLVVAASCSVTTPREGFTISAQGGVDGGLAPGAGGEGGGGGTGSGSFGTSGGGSGGPGAGGQAGGIGGGGGGGTGGGGATSGPQAGTGGGGGPRGGSSGGSTEVGVTADTITISFLGGYSGPVGELTRQVYTGFETWVRDVNANGGIHGRKVVVKQVDHEDSEEGGVAACREVLGNGSFMAVMGVGGSLSIPDCFEKAKFPNFYNYAVAATYKPWTKFQFSMLTHQDDSLAATVTFIKNKLGHGKERQGLICQTGPVSEIACKAFLREAAAEPGFDPKPHVEWVEPNQAQFTQELLAMQGQDVEHITMTPVLESAHILRDARAMPNYNPHFTIGIFAFDFVTTAGRDLYEGVTGLRNGATTDSPGFASYKAKAQKYGTQAPDTIAGEALIVYGEGLIVGKALDLAGPQPTHESLVKGLENIGSYYNQVTPPMTYTASDHHGTHAAFPAVCCQANWQWKRLGDPKRRF